MKKTELDGNEIFSGPKNGVRFSWLISGEAIANDLTIQPGDVVILDGANTIKIWGKATFIDVYSTITTNLPITSVRRLKDLKDTTGGCNVSTDGSLFRRLQVAWQAVSPGSVTPDGQNSVGCHTVMMNDNASSRAHYHPSKAIGGGRAQREMYFVLDANQVFSREHYKRLWDPAGRHGIETWEDPESQGALFEVENPKTRRMELWRGLTRPGHFTPLVAGDVVCIDANVGHRGVGTVANVVALPGFKPQNEIYLENAFLVKG